MSKLFKVVALMLAFVLAMPAYMWADIEDTASIGVTASIGAAGTYSLSASLSGALAFNVSTVTTADAWRVGSAYVDIDLSAPTNTTWGLRIVTDNVVDLTAITRNPATGLVSVAPDASGIYNDGAGHSFAGFDLVAGPGGPYSYAGLIRASAMDNPSMRAAFSWQVSGYNHLGTAVPAAIPSRPVAADVGDWNDVWAFLSDKCNTGYRSSALVADINTHTGGKVVYRDDTFPVGAPDGVIDSRDSMVTNYTLVAYGTPYGRYLATHPYTDLNGDGRIDGIDMRRLSSTEGTAANPWDIYVYLAAQFANHDYTEGVDFVLPAGDYTTSTYLELFSE